MNSLDKVEVSVFISAEGRREQVLVGTMQLPVRSGVVRRGVQGTQAFGLELREGDVLEALFKLSASVSKEVRAQLTGDDEVGD